MAATMGTAAADKGLKEAKREITAEMVEAGSAIVCGYLRQYDVDSPSLCSDIAEQVLKAGLSVLKSDAEV